MTGSIREVGAYRGPVDWEAGDSTGGPPTDPAVAARLQRAEAAARLASFAAGDSTGNPVTEVDYDRRPQAAIPNAVLFERQSGDADAVDARDVRQGRLGDCYLLAPLAAMSETPEGRAFLRNAIVENKNANGDVVSYTVTLHEPQHGRFGRTPARDVPVTVDRLFMQGHAAVRPEGAHNEIWPLVMEKACATYLGGYSKLDRPGSPSEIMTLLTGRESTSYSLDWPRRWLAPCSEATLKADLASGKPVILRTRSGIAAPTGTPETETAHGLVPAHAYFVQGIEQHDGTTVLRLGNPWPDAQPVLVPFDELPEWFSSVDVGSLR